jgi:PilZ domain
MARPVSRFPFSASAEVASDDSVEVTRVTELTRCTGVIWKLQSTEETGMRVTVKITSKDQVFEATAMAIVLYSRPMAMAVAFREVKPLFRSILEDWLHQSLNLQDQKPSLDNLKQTRSIALGALMSQKTRRSPRFPFIAIAEIAYKESEGRLSCQVATLSLHGCYVEVPDTLPVGREVSIKIFAQSECFAAVAKVVYELPNLAMGLAFEEVSMKSQTLLRQWLLKAGGGPDRL